MSVEVISPAPRGVWAELVVADREALACQTPAWMDAMCATRGYADASRLYTLPGGVRALLPLARRRGPLPAALAPQGSMPAAWGMGGVLADGPITPQASALIIADLAALPAVRTTVRPNPLHAGIWVGAPAAGAHTVRRRAHVLDLKGGPDGVWRGYSGPARTALRKAQRAPLEVRCGAGDALLADFGRLYSLSLMRWAAAQHEPVVLARARARARDAPAKFRCIADALGDALRVSVAYRDGVAVAALVVLLGRNASYTRGAMDKALAGPVAANDLLHWLAIREACEAGCLRYHMGESGTSRSLARFKEKLGARPVDYAEYRFERLPLTRADAAARRLVKRAVGFRDAA